MQIFSPELEGGLDRVCGCEILVLTLSSVLEKLPSTTRYSPKRKAERRGLE